MKYKIKHGLFLLCLFISFTAVSQSWRFSDCRDLEVMHFTIDSFTETAQIDVYNHCDTCEQHVYTGLKVWGEQGTLAISPDLFSRSSPDNNTYQSYSLVVTTPFSIADVRRIEMTGLCDSIPIKDTHLNIQEKKFPQISITPNPAKNWISISTTSPIETMKLHIYDAWGRNVKHMPLKGYTVYIGNLPKGIYYIILQGNNLVLSQKLLIQ